MNYAVSKLLFTTANIIRLLLGVAITNHFLACGWYAIGRLSKQVHDDEGGEGYWFEHLDYTNATMRLRYIVSYHWSIAQFTPCAANYHPQSFMERCYAVGMLFIGLVLFSSLLGSVTALINEARKAAFARLKEDDLMRGFLNRNHVPAALMHQVLSFMKEHHRSVTASKKVLESEVPAFSALPPTLQEALRLHAYEPHLEQYALFAVLFSPSTRIMMKELCHTGVTERRYVKGEELFQFLDPAKRALLVSEGEVVFYRVHKHSSEITYAIEAEGDQVRVGTRRRLIIAEVGLWTRWEHLGLLVADMPTILQEVQNDKFRAAAEKHLATLTRLRRYAKRFLAALEEHRKINGPSYLEDVFELRGKGGESATAEDIDLVMSATPHL